MITRTSVRWRLVAWVTGVLLAVLAVIFVVVYEQTGNELRAEIDQDVAGDTAQLSQAVKSLRAASPEQLLAQMGTYLRAQRFSTTSSLLFAAIPGHGSISNPPELLGRTSRDDGETGAEQARENAMVTALLSAPTRITTQRTPDVGNVRLDEGVLEPRMDAAPMAAREIRILAESFNHMLDRLADAFSAQREFIADASHELRTPLTVIAGQLEVLAAQDRPEPDEVRRVERLVAAEIARTSRLVDDMLLLARSERHDFLQYRDFELEPFIGELWLTASLGEQRDFELGPIPDALLTADPDRLAQALRTLIR